MSRTTDLDGPVDEWRRIRDEVREQILTQGYDDERGTFVQHFDTKDVDASLLLIPVVGFLPGDDPRVLGTIKAVEEDLISRRAACCATGPRRGSTGSRGTSIRSWPARSGWSPRWRWRAASDDADALMRRLLDLTNDLGLLSEEYDPVHERMVGNYPQAFSHLALVSAAISLSGGSVPHDRGRTA